MQSAVYLRVRPSEAGRSSPIIRYHLHTTTPLRLLAVPGGWRRTLTLVIPLRRGPSLSTPGGGQPQHSYPLFLLRDLRCRASARTLPEDRVLLHASTRFVVEHGRDRDLRLGPPVCEQATRARRADVAKGGASLI